MNICSSFSSRTTLSDFLKEIFSSRSDLFILILQMMYLGFGGSNNSSTNADFCSLLTLTLSVFQFFLVAAAAQERDYKRSTRNAKCLDKDRNSSIRGERGWKQFH